MSEGAAEHSKGIAAVLLHAEEGFRTVKGFRRIAEVIERIQRRQNQEKTELQAV